MESTPPTANPGALTSPLATEPASAHGNADAYEPRDTSIRAVMVFMGALITTIILALIIVWVIMNHLVAADRSSDPLVSPVPVDQPAIVAPLQPSWNHDVYDRQDMDAMREQTQRVLHSSGTNPVTGRRFIDIDQAMTLVLPALPTSQPSGATQPADASRALKEQVAP